MAVSAGLKSGSRILICDDERHIVRLIEVNLRRQGYDVVTAHGGAEAIKHLETDQGSYDLALIDLEMPDPDGYAVLTWIRTHEATLHLRVMMTVPEDVDPSKWEHQADSYFRKPFNPWHL